MSPIYDKTVILSFHQLLLLLYKMEIKDILLPKEISELSADERQLKEAFGELITDKYLIPGADEKYTMNGEIRQIMDVLSNASCTYVISEERSKFNPCYIYSENLSCVCLCLDEHHPEWVKLELGDFEEKLRSFSDYRLARIKIDRFMKGSGEVQKSFTVDAEEVDKLLEGKDGFS